VCVKVGVGFGREVVVAVGVSVYVKVGVGFGREVVVAVTVCVVTGATVAVGVSCCAGLASKGGRTTMSTSARATMLASLWISACFRAILLSLP
jgi:hypothetical protein